MFDKRSTSGFSLMLSYFSMDSLFLVRSMEKSVCPICMGELEIIGSKKRYVIVTSGNRKTLVVRRMRCLNNVCRKINDLF